ncbi:uncharacterized protein [Prorops nasuta]|uniref:uncharacterized protein n=1 Tax=Prorops nasuta TaxID=863751 RepID=UPI0034CD2B72
MSIVDNENDDGYYMPHHAIIKEANKTGISLNDILMVGPTIQSRLVQHLTRFRMYHYVLTADIEKMYRQVLLHEEDRKYQKVLWRQQGVIRTFQLNTLTFGVSSSPFLAIRTVHKLAEDEAENYPKASKIIKEHLYVDDLLTGANTIEEARSLRNEIITLLSKGGFTIHQWSSNEPAIIQDLPSHALHSNFILKIDNNLKTLGVTWNANDDNFCYTPKPISRKESPSKRSILAEIAKIFDPLGLLGPIILYLKRLMQNIWRAGIAWDESLPQNIYTEWIIFLNQWDLMGSIRFQRKLLIPNYQKIQMHGFCDASNIGYGACIYVRSCDKNGNTTSHLLNAKSRVAPLKTLTIPRLELCGAFLLAQLFHEVSNTIDIKRFEKCIFWCDSMIALHRLKTPAHRLKTYVANRVTSTIELSGDNEWRYIPSRDNPADSLSRGQLPCDFSNNQLWRHGPSWIIEPETNWPKRVFKPIEIPELKENVCLSVITSEVNFLNKFSSFDKTVRIVAYYIIAELDKNRSVESKKYANLSPFLDNQGLLRVRGRLHKSNMSFAQKHPILIPKHHLTDCIIRETHERLFHAGIQTTLYNIRQRFWLTNGKNYVRKIVRSCIKCFRFRPTFKQCIMGNLPESRVNASIPFSHTGVDFCGPFYIKEKKFRNRNKIKNYVSAFICMSIKAVHLEIVTDLTSEGFIAALRRFTSRRGIPQRMYSDNGTNFVGANNELKEIYRIINVDENLQNIKDFATKYQIQWHFIPPATPHFGGLWESTVKIFKHHLYRVVNDALFTLEEFNTLVIEIEGVINSRPIIALSADPNDLQALSPSHYLIGHVLTSIPETNLSEIPGNRLSMWQHISKIRQDFWKRWSYEYLNELQVRSKWSKGSENIKINTLVLIKNKNLPCSQWSLGRVKDLHPGQDGIIRAVILHTNSGDLKRGTNYICPLPLEE